MLGACLQHAFAKLMCLLNADADGGLSSRSPQEVMPDEREIWMLC